LKYHLTIFYYSHQEKQLIMQRYLLRFGFLAIIVLIFSSASQKIKQIEKKQTKYKLRTIVIDAGHGGLDPGTLGKTTKEKDITLPVALKLGELIKENMPGVQVIQTRSTDIFVKLYDRADIANRNQADLFLSIHCNSIPLKSPLRQTTRGLEVFVLGADNSEANLAVAKRENSVILMEDGYKKTYGGFDPNSPQAHIMLALQASAYLENSLRFSSEIETQYTTRLQRKSRGLKQAGFLVLRQATMPSVLVELGFLSNDEEEQYLKNPENQVFIASALFRAFRSYKDALEK
jgi:N-acetylmuramoyl-L-alanine amidase